MNNFDEWSQIISRFLKAEADLLTSVAKHEIEADSPRFAFIRSVLELFLPSNYAIGSGRIIDSSGNSSDSIDIVIYRRDFPRLRNGLSAPPQFSLNTMLQVLSRPRWCLNMLGTRRHSFGNIVGHAKGVGNLSSLSSWTAEQFDPKLAWSDIDWIRERWGGKLILKGILDPEDAKMAVKTGADAIIVSNHGGRQLDGAQSSISALPEIIEAVGKSIEVHFDGGIRSGQDVLKAICLGAKSTYIGRAYIYGLGARGETGVNEALNIIYQELDTTMALCGERLLSNLGHHNLLNPPNNASPASHSS